MGYSAETVKTTNSSKELKIPGAISTIQCLAVEYSIRPELILSTTKDGAAVNEAALNQVKFNFRNIFGIACFSHVIDSAGRKFPFRILDAFIRHWNNMFSHSPTVRLAWKTKTGKAMSTCSATTWWSK